MAASYPTSVKVFTAKVAAQAIDGGHVNDLQDEVAAIEGGLLNGTAPLNSSNSTVANLSVTGGSTLATLNVTGGSTFAAMSLGASTLASLSVTGGSTLATVNAGASTLASLSVTGNSTLAAVNAGASTWAGALMPSADSTYALGNSTRRWIIDGAQITPGSIPSTTLSTTGTVSTSACLTGGGWVASTTFVTISLQALPSTVTFSGSGAETAIPITTVAVATRAMIVVNGIGAADKWVTAARVIDSTSVGITTQGSNYPATSIGLSGYVIGLP